MAERGNSIWINTDEKVIISNPMPVENLPKIYLYRRIVQAKLFIDRNFEESIDFGAIAGDACYFKFHFR